MFEGGGGEWCAGLDTQVMTGQQIIPSPKFFLSTVVDKQVSDMKQ